MLFRALSTEWFSFGGFDGWKKQLEWFLVMKLSTIIEEDCIIPKLKARDKKGVLEELAQVISHRDLSIDQGALVKVLLERERLGSTGIGDGVAIPHGRLKDNSHTLGAFI